MVRKKLAVVVAALGTLQAGMVSALGLGDFSLNSALNQPLDAEIQLLNTRDLDPSQVIVRLAPADDFKTAGVSRDYFLTNLKFAVILNDDGTGVIKITSHDSVVEPYLDFLVEARWPSGRLLREYTVLLDLPVFSDSQPAAVQPAQIQQAAPAPASAPVAARVDSGSTRQTLSQGELTAGEDYRVQQSDTLWEIAAKARPNDQVSIQQTMLGIQRLNPNAFIKGNINNLKAGYVLRLPTEDQVQDITAQSAVSQVASQNRQWKTGESPAVSDSGAQLDATDVASSSSDQAANQARLSLGSGGSSASSSVGDGSGTSAEGLQALQQELDQAKEGLDETDRENEELQSRLQDMEARIATLQRLLELKDDQLASMQGGVVTDEQAVDEQAADIVEAEAVLAEAETELETETDLEAEIETEIEAEAAIEAVEQEASDVAQTPEPIAQEPGLVDRVLANPLYAGAGLVLLVLIVLLVMRKKKPQEDEVEIEAVDDIEFEQPPEEESLTSDVAPEMEASDDIADMELDVGDFGTDLDEFEEPVAEEPEEVIAVAEPASAQPETGDAIAEADIYIAYGRYQQAIDLLSAAVAQSPQRADLHVKLMEVYLETRDKPGFQQQYGSLQALGDDAAIVQVKEMLSTVDGVSDWLDGVGSAPSAITDEDMDAELIEGEEQDLLLDLDGGEIELELDDAEVELDLDLDLDDDADLTLEVPAAGSELGDDFDLDLDESSLDELSSSDTIQFDAVDLEGASDSDLGDLQLDDLTLDEDDDVELVLDVEEPIAEEPAAEVNDGLETVASETTGDDFDLDLDDDFDLDLDDLSASVGELDDLEAEFDGGSNAEPEAVVELESAAEFEPELSADNSDELDELDLSAELGDLDLGAEEPAVLDAVVADVVSDAATDDLELPEEPVQAEPEAEDDDDFDFLADTDEVATKLDLARAYIDMGDSEGAKDILDEVAQEGSDEQKQEASALLERID